jgi:hypothetical protein
MDRLPVMYGEQSQDCSKLYEALAKAQGDMANAPRTKKSHYGMYADLATVRDVTRAALSKNGLCIIQAVVPYGQDGETAVATTLGHTSGQWIRSCIPIKANLTPQQLAANVTYARRIALSAIVGIAADDDDDGEEAEKNHAAANLMKHVELVARAEKKLQSLKTDEERKPILAHVARLAASGEIKAAESMRLFDTYGPKEEPDADRRAG